MDEKSEKQIEKNAKIHWLSSPLFVAAVSTLIFGSIVAGLGSCFQHRNWIKQNEIAFEQTIRAKLFDGRSEISQELSYSLRMLYPKYWSLIAAIRVKDEKKIDAVKKEINELFGKNVMLIQKIMIYFKPEEKKLIEQFVNILDKFNSLKYLILNEFSAGELTYEEIITYFNNTEKEINQDLYTLTTSLAEKTVSLLYGGEKITKIKKDLDEKLMQEEEQINLRQTLP